MESLEEKNFSFCM